MRLAQHVTAISVVKSLSSTPGCIGSRVTRRCEEAGPQNLRAGNARLQDAISEGRLDVAAPRGFRSHSPILFPVAAWPRKKQADDDQSSRDRHPDLTIKTPDCEMLHQKRHLNSPLFRAG
jgi:hypothetical protein